MQKKQSHDFHKESTKNWRPSINNLMIRNLKDRTKIRELPRISLKQKEPTH